MNAPIIIEDYDPRCPEMEAFFAGTKGWFYDGRTIALLTVRNHQKSLSFRNGEAVRNLLVGLQHF